MAIQSSINSMIGTVGTVAAVAEHLQTEKEKNILEATKQFNEANLNAQEALKEVDRMQEGMDYTDKRITELEDKTDLHQDEQGRWRNNLNQFAKADKSLEEELSGLRETKVRQEKQMELIQNRKNVVDQQLEKATERYNKYTKGGKL